MHIYEKYHFAQQKAQGQLSSTRVHEVDSIHLTAAGHPYHVALRSRAVRHEPGQPTHYREEAGPPAPTYHSTDYYHSKYQAILHDLHSGGRPPNFLDILRKNKVPKSTFYGRLKPLAELRIVDRVLYDTLFSGQGTNRRVLHRMCKQYMDSGVLKPVIERLRREKKLIDIKDNVWN